MSTSTALPESLVGSLTDQGLDVDGSDRRRSEYSYDASNYRVRPLAVVFPRNADDVVTVVRFCTAAAVPLIPRGGGTSMAGNAVGTGVVLDFSRHMDRILAVDEDSRTVSVEPGVILSTLSTNAEATTQGRLTFAPDPSSRNRATVGGALGNDACGNHSVRHGRTSDHVLEIDLVTADGHRLTATGSGLRATHENDHAAVEAARRLSASLAGLVDRNRAAFRLELGRIPRQVSGFHLGNLLGENGFSVARALVGSEGTCAVIVGARMRLVPKAPAALLVCLGYADVVEAARDIDTILAYSPAAIEGVDEAIVDTMRWRRGSGAVTGLPVGGAFLFVDLDGENRADVAAQATQLIHDLRGNGRLLDGRAVPDPAQRASLWRVREDGAGLAARLRTGGESWAGWEDSAVAPSDLADYLADFRALLDRHGLAGVMYGHFGAGCMHIRITFDLRSDEGRHVMDAFTKDAARLVVRHGGSLSGEHGDGRARSALLPLMYSNEMMQAFAEFKAIWDPAGVLNPGQIVDPAPITADLALSGVPQRQWRTSFELRAHATKAGAPQPDAFVSAVQGCIGVGRCRSDSGGVMCPSYRATRDEKDSTRGRARVLQDMVRGAATPEKGWKSEAVREVLDLCLSCKACSSDCPVGVDMATYKSEFFSHYYEGRFRPLSHYSLGWLPRWLAVTGRLAPVVNALLRSPAGRLVAAAGGLTTKRKLPDFASARAWKRELHAATRPGTDAVAAGTDRGTGAVGTDSPILFVDTFTRGFRPQVAGAAARVLQAVTAGDGTPAAPLTCSSTACCGLTWISTGQLGTARKVLARTAAALDDGTERPIVVIEPSCAAALRKDLPELVPTEQARRVAHRVRSFAAYLTEQVQAGWNPDWRDGPPASVTVQTHCHEYSVFGAGIQKQALTSLGVASVREATGCCGVAGNFGFEADHYEVSMQVAEQALIPALEATVPGEPVLTDGFSCLMQVQHLDPDRPGLHLAELLDQHLVAGKPTES
ncbi:MAG: FAD-linked oxidase [Micrococcaceae bacterium]|nr:FAD-linked oxidase [Micrococcaceae bacterium]